MTDTSAPSAPRPPAQPTGPSGPTRPARPSRPPRSGSRIAALVVGGLLSFVALGTLASGGVILAGHVIATDGDGYVSAPTERVESDGVAIVADDIDLDADADDSAWLLNRLDVDVRLRVDGAFDTTEVFVGVGRTADVQAYLADAPHTEFVDVDPIRYDDVPGDRAVSSPLDQNIWVEAAMGNGEVELVWEPRGGDWSVVVMNADGSSVVTADVDAAVRAGAVVPIGVSVLLFGSVIAVVAIGLIVFGARRGRPAGGSDDGLGSGPLPSPAPAATPGAWWSESPVDRPGAEVSADPVGADRFDDRAASAGGDDVPDRSGDRAADDTVTVSVGVG